MRLVNRLYRLLAVTRCVQSDGALHVGLGSRLWAPVQLRIGRDVYIGKFCTIEVDGEIGDGVLIANNVGIVGRRDHDFRQVGVPVRRSRWVADPEATEQRLTTIIGSDVWIGYGAIVLSGVRIGDSTIVSAGSVVTEDLPSNSICSGNPARPIRARFSESAYAQHWACLEGAGLKKMSDCRGSAGL